MTTVLGKATCAANMNREVRYLHYIKAICLDLDDTLWDLAPVIRRAEQAVYTWLAEHYPQVTRIYSARDMRSLRQNITAEFPGQCHDLSLLRKQTYARMAAKAGCSQQMVQQAFDVFQTVRNDVSPFEDVVPALQRMNENYSLLALTNGNADLRQIGLADYFDYIFTARELGASKPDPVVFDHVCRHSRLDPSAILHVGDNPRNDIEAARQSGMTTAWVNRKSLPWPELLAEPDYMVTDLEGLADLLSR